MFPDVQFLGMDIYYWMFVLGVLAAMVAARIFSDRAGIGAKVFNLSLFSAVFGVIFGYLASLLLESFWEFLETGEFAWGAGSTFYGGLIGAAAVYLGVYFLAGKFYCKKKEHIAEFPQMLSLAAPCIALAHGVGRIGCLFNGCCYGARTDAWYGIDMLVAGEWQRRVPLQLFEAIFLFALAALLFFLFLRYRFRYNASLYLASYGVWRFAVEFFRDDDRGASGIASLSPSQLISLLLILAGIALALVLYLRAARGKKETPAKDGVEEGNDET